MIGTASALQMGCALGVATILSVGPTNLTVLREGLTRGHIGLVVVLFTMVNTAMMSSAWLVADVLRQLEPGVQTVLSWLGIAVMLYFAYKSFRAAARHAPRAPGMETREARWACACRVLPVMLLNPLVYLEFFFVPAAIFRTLDGLPAEFNFMAGVIMVSFVGFCAFGFGGRIVGNIIAREGALRVFDRTSGVILSGVAAVLAVSLLSAG